jgi:hypothetical protein
VRIALHPASEVGQRAALILLAERDTEALGFYGHRGASTEDRRSMAITHLTGFSLLASDDFTAPLDLAAIAAEDGLSCVLCADADPPPSLTSRFTRPGLTLLIGAGLPGLAEVLRFHKTMRSQPEDEVLLGWTIEGKPLRRGRAVPFPGPLGARRGRPYPGGGSGDLIQRFEVPVEGPWAGALASTAGRVGGKMVRRLVAVADDRLHLQALALAAGALLVARGSAPAGLCRPADAAPAYLDELTGLGLELAGFEAAN